MSYRSNLNDFIDNFNKKIDKSLEQILELAEESVKEEAPVRSGNLRDSHRSKKEDNKGYVFTEVPYAPYVELGTARQSANPYFRRGIKKIEEKSIIILRRELKI